MTKLVDSNNSVCTASQVREILVEYIDCLEKNWPRVIFGNYNMRNIIIESSMISPCDNNLQIINKVRLETLDFDAYLETPIFLLGVEKYLVNYDHYFYWSFGADILKNIQSFQSSINGDIYQRFFLLMDTIFSQTYNPWQTPDTKRIFDAQIALSPKRFNRGTNHIIIAHLSYPLIDGLLKLHWSKCKLDNNGNPELSGKKFVSEDGENVQMKQILENKKISNLALLLRSVEHFTKNDTFKANLKLFREHFETTFSNMYDDKKGYDIISEQRNSLLHGGRPWDKLFAGLVNLIFILINALINEEEYNEAKQRIVHGLTMKGNFFQDMSYYPPV